MKLRYARRRRLKNFRISAMKEYRQYVLRISLMPGVSEENPFVLVFLSKSSTKDVVEVRTEYLISSIACER